MEFCKNDENAFVCLDPPYLCSINSGYIPQNDRTDMTHIIVYIKEYLETCKCKVMLIINKLKLLEYLFEDFIKGSYNRIYQLSKKNNSFNNYKLWYIL